MVKRNTFIKENEHLQKPSNYLHFNSSQQKYCIKWGLTEVQSTVLQSKSVARAGQATLNHYF